MKRRVVQFTAALIWMRLCLPGLDVYSNPVVPEIQLSHRARSLQPGEVVLMTASCSTPLKSLQAFGFDKEFRFFPTENALLWQGLVGIDLETAPGTHSVQLRAVTEGGAIVEAGYPLSVRGKEFPVRRLTVPDRFVTPPQEEQERIRVERKRVSRIFKTVSGEKLWKERFLRPVPGKATAVLASAAFSMDRCGAPTAGPTFEPQKAHPSKRPMGEELYWLPIFISQEIR